MLSDTEYTRDVSGMVEWGKRREGNLLIRTEGVGEVKRERERGGKGEGGDGEFVTSSFVTSQIRTMNMRSSKPYSNIDVNRNDREIEGEDKQAEADGRRRCGILVNRKKESNRERESERVSERQI